MMANFLLAGAKSRLRRWVFAASAASVAAGLVILASAQTGGERVIKISAERYEFSPDKIVLRKGEPVILELTSSDRIHGFHVKALHIDADVLPGQFARVRVVPDQVGVFPFGCDLFCGSGHSEMGGVITVTN